MPALGNGTSLCASCLQFYQPETQTPDGRRQGRCGGKVHSTPSELAVSKTCTSIKRRSPRDGRAYKHFMPEGKELREGEAGDAGPRGQK